ncbi:MAG: hypothetical protein KH452_05945 [Clostridiales bacterium]|nr:hypothetical protein [Clostridiales bacterium]
MLSKSQVVKARELVEKLYTGSCTVMEYQKYRKENRSTGNREVVVLEGQPCRLSHYSSPSAGSSEIASSLEQSIKVYMAPEIVVKPGSKMVITQNGVKETYQSSGKPAVYQTHQEVSLKLFEGWA